MTWPELSKRVGFTGRTILKAPSVEDSKEIVRKALAGDEARQIELLRLYRFLVSQESEEGRASIGVIFEGTSELRKALG